MVVGMTEEIGPRPQVYRTCIKCQGKCDLLAETCPHCGYEFFKLSAIDQNEIAREDRNLADWIHSDLVHALANFSATLVILAGLASGVFGIFIVLLEFEWAAMWTILGSVITIAVGFTWLQINYFLREAYHKSL